ncbi:oligosaccharide flippase family protein [Cohnella sp. GCM10020058]|uniref:oligosaccharide flippase family protein n=1 Tax=Cohnella sp. GCM10020058 TaxID=3317330 RepID=UPI003632E57A
MKKLFLSSFALNIGVLILNLVTGIMMARWLGSYGRGEFAAATRWASLLTGLSALGLPGAVIYLGKRQAEKQRELFGSYLILGVSFGLFGLIVGESILPLLMNGENEGLNHARIAMLSVPFAVLADGLIGTLQSLNQFKRVMALRALSPIGSLLVIVVLEAMGNLNPRNLILGFIVLWSFLLMMLATIWVMKSLKPTLRGFMASGKALMGSGVKIYGGSLVSIFGGNFDQLILSLALSPYALGLYTVASSIGGILPSVLFGALNVFLTPKLMDMNKERRQLTVERMHGLFLYGTAAFAIFVSALLPFALPLLYGEEYRSAIVMAAILLYIAPIRICCQMMMYYLNTVGRFNTVSISEAVSVGGGLIGLILLMPVAGATAAALGIVIASLVKWIIYIAVLRREGLRIRMLFVVQKSDFSRLPYLLNRYKSAFARRRSAVASKQ